MNDKKIKEMLDMVQDELEKASYIAEDLANLVQNEMINKLKNLDDASDFFQAKVYHMLSSFFLAVCLKIFELKKIDKALVDRFCEECIIMAKDSVNKGNFKVYKEH